MTDRIKRMRERWQTTTFPLCISRMRAAFPVIMECKGLHPYVVRSKVHEAMLTKCPVAIEPDDLICGVGASKAFGIEMDYEMGRWTPDEVQALKEENYTITPEEEEELYKYMEIYASGDYAQTTAKISGDLFGDDPVFWPLFKSGIVLPPTKSKVTGSGGGRAQSGMGLNPMGLYVPDYEVVLKRGLRDIINECKERLANHHYVDGESIRKKLFWEGCIRVMEALIVYANRYADLAEKMAKEEKDPVRAKELEGMAANCRRVPEYPPETFREAIQCFWFLFLMMNPSSTAAAGRFDQYMYPFYKKDLEEGRITRDEALELLEILRLKDFQLNRVSGRELRKKNAGMAKWHNWTIGGVDDDGNDATNDITYLELEAAQEVPTPHHTVTLRVHPGTPDELMQKALELVRTGIGMPAFVGDKSYIDFFMSRGLTAQQARRYSMAGCVDGLIAGVTRAQVAAMFIVTLVYDIFMHNGYCPWLKENVGIQTGDVCEMKTFEEYKEAFYKQLKYLIELEVEGFNAKCTLSRELMPDFIRSVMTNDCLEQGREAQFVEHRPFDAFIVCSAVGVINVSDSLAAVKTLVYDQKKYTMKQLMTALDANWEGYEDMRQDFVKAPKYGNDDDFPDLLAAEVYQKYADYMSACDALCGGKAVPNAISITAHQPGGQLCGATPDGRFKGEILADASMSPGQGRDNVSPTAAFKSAMKINQDAYQATLMNMKLHPTALKSDEDLHKLGTLIKTYLTHGGKHIQFNVVTRETMEAAKKEPEKHKDLIVRVAGYSAYFTLLTPQVQDEVINRTSYSQL